MSVTEAADALVLVATIAASIDNIDVISVQDLTGEIFRKVPTDIEVVTATKKNTPFGSMKMRETEASSDCLSMVMVQPQHSERERS